MCTFESFGTSTYRIAYWDPNWVLITEVSLNTHTYFGWFHKHYPHVQPCKSAAVGGEERPTTSLEELGRKRTAGHLSVSVGKKKKSDKACFSAGATSKCNAELSGMKKKFKSSKKSKKSICIALCELHCMLICGDWLSSCAFT